MIYHTVDVELSQPYGVSLKFVCHAPPGHACRAWCRECDSECEHPKVDTGACGWVPWLDDDCQGDFYMGDTVNVIVSGPIVFVDRNGEIGWKYATTTNESEEFVYV